jgi:histone H3/H4
MNPTAQKLLDAQVAYTLHQLSGDQIQKTIGDETKLIYQWVAKQNLSDIFSQERVKAFGQRLIEDASVSDSTKAYFESLTKAVLDDIAKEDIEIDDLITKNTWDRIVEKVVEQRKFREEIVHKITTNQFYGEMLSEIIYNSIKSFTQQSPMGSSSDKGLGGLFNVGKGLLGAALSGMEDTIDKNVKKFLSDNINKTLRDSEKIIHKRLTDENIRKGANKLWDKLDELNFKELAEKAKKYTSSGKDSTSDLVAAVAMEVKNSSAFNHINEVILNHFYTTYGNQPIQVLMEELNITEEIVVRESINIAEDILGRMNSTGFLEQRIRQQLQPFYETKEVQAIFN